MVVSKRKKKELPIRPLRICSKMSWKVFHPPFSDTFTRPFLHSKTLTPPPKNIWKTTSPPNIIEVSPLLKLLIPQPPEWNQPRPAATTPNGRRCPRFGGLSLLVLDSINLEAATLLRGVSRSRMGEFSDPTWGWLRWKKITSQIFTQVWYTWLMYIS